MALLRKMQARGFANLSMLLRNKVDFAPDPRRSAFKEMGQAEALARAQPVPSIRRTPPTRGWGDHMAVRCWIARFTENGCRVAFENDKKPGGNV